MATESSVMAVIRASRPIFRNPNDKLAFAVHASFLAAGYSLIATGSRACSENFPTDGEEVGIEGWNDYEDQYGFVYLKSCKDGKIPILVKCLSIGDALVVDVLNLKENEKEPFHIHIHVKDHVSNGDCGNNYGEMYKNLERLVEILNAGIFNKLDAITGSSASGTSSSKSGHSASESAYPVQCQEPPPILRNPPVPPTGGSDLFPGPGAGVFPSRGPGIGGSMLIGPNDPRWFPGGEIPGRDFPGGDLIPPGARFDPIGPPDVPGFDPGRFVRQPPRGPGRSSGVHPDLEHFQDPDYI